ncbi:MAG: Rpn family recombination-promoting nuclease/putative transposase, partial [Eubacterium sp.]|nr:Rpn family recombination-promoting nuclease/putative transposase [Eubacterium sp.]
MKRYQELSFTDDFMFCKVMTANPELCRRILELILGKKVKKVVMHGSQKTIDITAGAKSIRMDVYLDDEEGTVYDLEMQSTLKPYLPKRVRYYQSMLDLNHLEKGVDYGELPHTAIIFVCTFDYFKKRLPVYTFENRCAELPELRMGDASEKIFVNPESERDGLDEDFCAFLDYLHGIVTENGLVRELEEEVEKARAHKEWEVEYMTW